MCAERSPLLGQSSVGPPTIEICPSCGWNQATSDGYCLDCARLAEDDGEYDVGCSHCGGEGLCYDGSDPLGNCPDEMHDCHACGGSGRGKDQVIF